MHALLLEHRVKRLWQKMRQLKRSNYEHALIQRGWYDLSARSKDDPIIIGGCGRSGTTLLREILNRHPRIYCGAETSMFRRPFWPGHIVIFWGLDEALLQRQVAQSVNLIRFAENFYRAHASAEGKARWADKTPNNIRAIERILTWFPRARFIHVLRDGRDVVCSLRNHPKQKIVNGELVPTNINRPISACTARWLKDTAKGLAFRGHPRYMEVKYENLVLDPENQIRQVCEFVGEDFSRRMLEPEDVSDKEGVALRLSCNANAARSISQSSIGRWRRDLTMAERHDFADAAGELLIVCGYADDQAWLREAEA
jgi:hypothetical protein